DGIRDDLVTGVQTCALPICSTGPMVPARTRPCPAHSGGDACARRFRHCSGDQVRASLSRSRLVSRGPSMNRDARRDRDADVDEALEETFPASDPPANTVETGIHLRIDA